MTAASCYPANASTSSSPAPPTFEQVGIPDASTSLQTPAWPTDAIAQYAAQYGVSVEKAGMTLEFQNESSHIEAKVHEVAADWLNGTQLRHRNKERLEVSLVEGAPTNIVEVVQSLSTNFALVSGESTRPDFTSTQLQEAAFAVEPFRLEGVGSADLGRLLLIDVSPEAGTSSSVPTDTLRALAFALGVSTEILQVRISTTVARGANSGGLPLSSCTSGFAVQNSAETRGLLTARRCGKTQAHSIYGSPGTKGMTYRAERRSASADLQWHTISGTVLARCYGSSTASTVTVTSSTSQAQQLGDYVCSRGKTSGYRCGTTSNIVCTPTQSDACPGTTCAATWVGVGAISRGGDSGGPWAAGGSAYGIHKGGSTTFSGFTSGNFLGSLGVAIV